MLLGVAALAVPSNAHAAEGARLSQDGWWARNSASVPPVPADALGVAAAAGDPERVAAVGIVVDLPPGAHLENLTLVLPEVAGPEANVNSRVALLTACPIKKGWFADKAGAWDRRPEYDCTGARADGTRAGDGTWSFDLTPIARQWLAGTPENGVAIVENVGAPTSFALALRNIASGGAALSVYFTQGEPSSTPEPEPEVSPPTSDQSEQPAEELPGEPLAEASAGAPATTDTTAVPEVRLAEPAGSRALASGRRAGDLMGNLSPGTVLLIPLVLAIAWAVGMTLGPAGDPKGRRHRMGGVSRAMAARAREGRQAD